MSSHRSNHLCFALLLTLFFLQSCVVYTAYGLYRTITDINATLTLINTSIVRIQGVVNEGENLKQAVDDGTLISSLAEKIPSLIQSEVERVTREKIELLSGDLALSSLDFTQNALVENLSGARKAYDDMAATFNRFTGLMNDLSNSIAEPLK